MCHTLNSLLLLLKDLHERKRVKNMLQTCNSEVLENKKSFMKVSVVFTELYKSLGGIGMGN